MIEEWCGVKTCGSFSQTRIPYRITMGNAGDVLSICLYEIFTESDEEAFLSTIKDALEFRRIKK